MIKALVAASLAALLCAPSAAQEGAASPFDALIGGEVDASLRHRYEWVDDDNFDQNANASPMRIRLGYTTARWRGFGLRGELEWIRAVGFDDEFDEGGGNTPDRSEFPVVADPDGTEMNQIYLSWAGGPITARLGRQRIHLDNQRFVGGVGWRQNEQTYDALSLRFERGKLDGFYAYLANVNRIFGDDVPAGDHDQDGTHLLNVGVDTGGAGKAGVYYYGIDNDDAPAFSTHTLGARLDGSWSAAEPEANGLELSWLVELAWQRDAANAPLDYTAGYYHARLGAAHRGLSAAIGWERLAGNDDPGEAFRTPLATLHAFQGWADRFLATPDAGIDDRYVKLGARFAGWQAGLRYHDFDAETGDADFGEELDLHIGRAFFGGRVRTDAYFARFDGDALADVTKAWLMLTLAL